MDRLLAGVATFQKDVFPGLRHLFEELADAQHPRALFVTCADSRIVPQLITQAPPGDLFICRNAGNMVPPYGEFHGGVSATIEYAVCALEVKHIVVLGHSDCGAMRGLLHPEKVASMPTVKNWLAHGEVARRVVTENYLDLDEAARLHALTKENIVAQLDHLRTHPSVASRLARGTVSLHGWMFHIGTGDLEAYNAQTGGFVPIQEYTPEKAVSRVRLALAS